MQNTFVRLFVSFILSCPVLPVVASSCWVESSVSVGGSIVSPLFSWEEGDQPNQEEFLVLSLSLSRSFIDIFFVNQRNVFKKKTQG